MCYPFLLECYRTHVFFLVCWHMDFCFSQAKLLSVPLASESVLVLAHVFLFLSGDASVCSIGFRVRSGLVVIWVRTLEDAPAKL